MNIKKGLIYCHLKKKDVLTVDSKNLLNLVFAIFNFFFFFFFYL